jgi:Uracil DNA glycosylase superfamily
MSLADILREVRACQICLANLPFGPRPVLQLASTARLLIIGQAPRSKVHQSGVPWTDASGDHLRDWLELDRSAFHDEARVAILPMGFCYPGTGENQGDKPPRPECGTPLAQPLAQASPRPSADALGRSIRPPILFGIRAEALHDGDRQGIFRVRSSILPAAASGLEEPNLDANQ